MFITLSPFNNEMRRLFVFRSFLLLLLCWTSCQNISAQRLNVGDPLKPSNDKQEISQEDAKDITDFKVIKEEVGKDGFLYREVQFRQGGFIVTQIVVSPPMPKVGDRKPINPDTLDRDSMMILVEKSQFLVAVLHKKKRIRQYRAVFGPDPFRDKHMEGDRSTPEGWFKVVLKREHKDWQKFILLDYPNEDSRRKFNERKANNTIPKNATIGHSIGIHGTFKGGEEMIDLGFGWTDGCVALKPEDINDLYNFVFPGMRVYVRGMPDSE